MVAFYTDFCLFGNVWQKLRRFGIWCIFVNNIHGPIIVYCFVQIPSTSAVATDQTSETVALEYRYIIIIIYYDRYELLQNTIKTINSPEDFGRPVYNNQKTRKHIVVVIIVIQNRIMPARTAADIDGFRSSVSVSEL